MSVVVVLHRSQNIINIAQVVRSMRNFGFADLRLVDPAEFDEYRIEGIAHGTRDVIDRIKVFDGLDRALGDCSFVAGLTARHRAVKRNVRRAREAAREIIERGEEGVAAILLGPEDRGLSNEDLDRCDISVTIDTTAEHPSLNLAQAFAIMAYETFLLRGELREFKPPRRTARPATGHELELLFNDVELSLTAIDFFKSKNAKAIMRTVREVTHRAALDEREARLLRGFALEVRHFLERSGVTHHDSGSEASEG